MLSQNRPSTVPLLSVMKPMTALITIHTSRKMDIRGARAPRPIVRLAIEISRKRKGTCAAVGPGMCVSRKTTRLPTKTPPLATSNSCCIARDGSPWSRIIYFASSTSPNLYEDTVIRSSRLGPARHTYAALSRLNPLIRSRSPSPAVCTAVIHPSLCVRW